LLFCEFHLNGRQHVEEEQSRSSRQGNFCKVNGRMPRPQRYVFIKNMSNRGIPIARRTVAKYRTELNILPSNMRRKYIQEWRGLLSTVPNIFATSPELNAWMASTKMLKDRKCNVKQLEGNILMAEAEAEKILVRAANGDLWLVRKGLTPQKVHSNDPNLQPQDPDLVGILNETDNNLASHFASANPGVKAGIAVVDFDGQY